MNEIFYKTIMTWNEDSFDVILQMTKDNNQILCSLYSYETIFSQFINYLFVKRQENQECEILLEMAINLLACNLIKTPEDILMCLKHIDAKEDQIEFTKRIIRNNLISNDILISLARNADVFRRLPYDLSWVEVPILKYGMTILSLDMKELSIFQICPLLDNVEDKSIIEYLLGWAFEENKLNYNGIAYFKNHFPKKYDVLNKLNCINKISDTTVL